MDNTESLSTNRAKQWQIALFPFNNAATNVYFAFYTYFNYFALLYLTGSEEGALVGTIVTAALALLVSTFNSVFAPLMRIFDGITDPIVGGMLDKTQTKIGKFRPYMIIGNILLAFSVILMMFISRLIPFDPSGANIGRWVIYIISYIIYVLGYTCQCACTKAGQTCLTNDPKQRSQFVIWNMVGQIGSIVLINVLAGGILTNPDICEKGLLINAVEEGGKLGVELLAEFAEKGINVSAEVLAEFAKNPTTHYVYNYGAPYGIEFYNIMVPVVVILSGIYTAMAVAAIAEKDRPEFWGVSDEQVEPKDYLNIITENKEIRWLVLSSGFNKLASTVATSGAVMCMLY